MSAETGADAAREIRATREAAGLYDYTARGKAVVGGSDRLEFLQGMLTSDVAALPEGRAQRSAIVTAMGKMIANLLLLKRHDDVLLEAAPGRASVVVETLAKYVITEDVELLDRTSYYAILSVQGPRSADALLAGLGERREILVGADEPFAFREIAWEETPLVILRHDRFRLLGYDVWVPAEHAAALRETIRRAGAPLGLVVCGADARETLRIAAGRPAWGREIAEDSFPGEVGLSSAVSVTKGCYIGQEVLSRIHHLGHVNRVLVRLSLREDAPRETPLALVVPTPSGHEEIGRVTSIAPCAEDGQRAALAIIRARASVDAVEFLAKSATGTLIPARIVDEIV